MDLDHGAMARLDRRLLAELGRDEQHRMVRVPVTSATWSTWKRYCDAVGTSMGRGIAALIEHELTGAVGDSQREALSVFERKLQDRLAQGELELASRKADLEVYEERLRRWSEHLRHREGEVEARELRLEVTKKLSDQSAKARTKVGRNEPCPCGSGLKH
jgi:hypothetical protein